MSSMIAHDVSKRYLKTETVEALKGPDFEMEAASFVSFVGPSCSGKTTLLNLIRCLDKPTSGILRLEDTDVSSLNTHTASSMQCMALQMRYTRWRLPLRLKLEELQMRKIS